MTSQHLLLLSGSSQKLLSCHQATTFSTVASGRTLDPSLQKYLTLDHLEQKVLRHCDMLQECIIKLLAY